jgi:hypothetical protein
VLPSARIETTTETRSPACFGRLDLAAEENAG